MRYGDSAVKHGIRCRANVGATIARLEQAYLDLAYKGPKMLPRAVAAVNDAGLTEADCYYGKEPSAKAAINKAYRDLMSEIAKYSSAASVAARAGGRGQRRARAMRMVGMHPAPAICGKGRFADRKCRVHRRNGKFAHTTMKCREAMRVNCQVR